MLNSMGLRLKQNGIDIRDPLFIVRILSLDVKIHLGWIFAFCCHAQKKCRSTYCHPFFFVIFRIQRCDISLSTVRFCADASFSWRGCLIKWYRVPLHQPLTEVQQEKIISLLVAWIEREYRKKKTPQ